MSQDNTAVEEHVETAASQEGVETSASSAHEVQTEDFIAVLEAKDQELAKVRAEKDNYKRGLLKAKGKVEEEDDSEDIDAKIDRKVNERLLDSKEAQLIQEKENLLKQALKRNKELETALKNRSQISPTGAGSHQETQAVSDNVISAEQIKNLKARGWNDEKITRFKENLLKQKGL